MSANLYTLILRAAVTGIILGIVGMIQPFVFELFKYGFLLLLASTIVYIVIAHISPRAAPVEELP
ncbi:MAG: hypothetical protein ABI874_03050 [Chloroflexota bacterium]